MDLGGGMTQEEWRPLGNSYYSELSLPCCGYDVGTRTNSSLPFSCIEDANGPVYQNFCVSEAQGEAEVSDEPCDWLNLDGDSGHFHENCPLRPVEVNVLPLLNPIESTLYESITEPFILDIAAPELQERLPWFLPAINNDYPGTKLSFLGHAQNSTCLSPSASLRPIFQPGVFQSRPLGRRRTPCSMNNTLKQQWAVAHESLSTPWPSSFPPQENFIRNRNHLGSWVPSIGSNNIDLPVSPEEPIVDASSYLPPDTNGDSKGPFFNYHTEVSDPPDLLGPLQEEQIVPPAHDMNPDDPDLIPRQQELRFENDLYTPKWVRGYGCKREAWCGICKPGRWLVLKNSAFWYDRSFTHGVSAATGRAFEVPEDMRRSDNNPKIWEGLCGRCGKWTALVSSKKKGTMWFRHAYKVSVLA